MARSEVHPEYPFAARRWTADSLPSERQAETRAQNQWWAFANLLTLTRILLTPLFVWWFLSSRWELRLLSLVVFVAAAITDWWDGHHARTHHSVTNVGRFLDPLADKFLTTSAMLTLVYQNLVALWMVAVIFVRDFILTWMRIRASRRGQTFRTLWLAKVKTTVQLAAIIVIVALWSLYTLAVEFQVYTEYISEQSLVWLFNALIAITMLLALISGGQYFWKLASRERARG